MPLLEGGSGITQLALVMLVAVIIVVASVAVLILFLPIKPVDIQQHREVPLKQGVDSMELSLVGEVGGVEVSFDDLTEALLTLDLRITGGASILQVPSDHNLSFE